MDDNNPKMCPFCGCQEISHNVNSGTWYPNNETWDNDLSEHQCRNDDCGKSFWT